MNQIKKIMAAIGMSEHAPGIIDYAAGLARAVGAELLIAHIINIRDVEALNTIADMGYDIKPENYIKEIKADRRAQIDQLLAATQFPTDHFKVILKVGHPVDALLKIILAEKVDTVVMGVKGRTNLENILVGSVAEKIFRRSPATIVSYRDPDHAAELKKHIHA
jgi:nucleotide-binding universal stress UspA family protein